MKYLQNTPIRKKKFVLLVVLSSFMLGNYLIAQPTIQNSSTNEGNAANAKIKKPSGVQNGDLLVIGLMFEKGSDEVITPPKGWLPIRRTNNGSDTGMASYYKIAGSSEPNNYFFALTNGSKWAIGITRISGAVTPSPIEVSAGSTGEGGNVTAPSITTLGDSRLVLCLYSNKKNATFKAHRATKEQYDDPFDKGGLPSNMMASMMKETAGATGDMDAQAAEKEKWVGQQIAIAPAAILPIELTSFDAGLCHQSSICLAWQTSAEINSESFTVEKSDDGVIWIPLQEIPGAGNSTTNRQYSASDPYPFSGMNYYRLKQTDLDGASTFSKITTVYFDRMGRSQVMIYPNPTSDWVLIEGSPTDLQEIEIFSLTGQKVTSLIQTVPQNESRSILHLNNLPASTYLIKTRTTSTILLKQ